MDGRGVRGRSPKPHGEYEGWGRVVYRVQGTGGSVHALSPWSIIAYGYFHVAMIADGYYSGGMRTWLSTHLVPAPLDFKPIEAHPTRVLMYKKRQVKER